MMIKHPDVSLYIVKSLTFPYHLNYFSFAQESSLPSVSQKRLFVSFAKVPECCDLEMWRQLDGKCWPQFRSSTTQNNFLNRPCCTYLETISLKWLTQTPVHLVGRVALTCSRPDDANVSAILIRDSHSFLSLGIFGNRKTIAYDLRELVSSSRAKANYSFATISSVYNTR